MFSQNTQAMAQMDKLSQKLKEVNQDEKDKHLDSDSDLLGDAQQQCIIFTKEENLNGGEIIKKKSQATIISKLR